MLCLCLHHPRATSAWRHVPASRHESSSSSAQDRSYAATRLPGYRLPATGYAAFLAARARLVQKALVLTKPQGKETKPKNASHFTCSSGFSAAEGGPNPVLILPTPLHLDSTAKQLPNSTSPTPLLTESMKVLREEIRSLLRFLPPLMLYFENSAPRRRYAKSRCTSLPTFSRNSRE